MTFCNCLINWLLFGMRSGSGFDFELCLTPVNIDKIQLKGCSVLGIQVTFQDLLITSWFLEVNKVELSNSSEQKPLPSNNLESFFANTEPESLFRGIRFYLKTFITYFCKRMVNLVTKMFSQMLLSTWIYHTKKFPKHVVSLVHTCPINTPFVPFFYVVYKISTCSIHNHSASLNRQIFFWHRFRVLTPLTILYHHV